MFLGQLSHPNLVKLIGYCCEDEHRVLIYEYMERGSVENNLFSRELSSISPSIAFSKYYFKQYLLTSLNSISWFLTVASFP